MYTMYSLKSICLATCLLAVCVPSVHPQSCNLDDAELLLQQRLRKLRANIIAQLGLEEEPTNTSNVTSTPPSSVEMEAAMATWNALRSAKTSMEREQERKCRSDDFFAKPVTSFVGTMSPQEIDVVKRDAVDRSINGSDSYHPQHNNVLSSYRILLDFELPKDLTSISQAHLLLYKMPSNTGPGYVVKDRRQFVEIKTIINSLGQEHVVEGSKYVAVSDVGYQAFEITSAVKLWVDKGINGSVLVEVNVYCYSSLNCNQAVDGKLPSKVQFLYAPDDNSKAPRVIVVSKNPLEVEHRNRFRRQTESIDDRFCSINETTCCLKNLTLNFREDLRINNIIEPRSFPVNYCQGYCPMTAGTQLMTPRLFEYLSRLGEGSPGSSIEPCCAGHTYQSLPVLVRGRNNTLETVQLQDVTVTSCRCV